MDTAVVQDYLAPATNDFINFSSYHSNQVVFPGINETENYKFSDESVKNDETSCSEDEEDHSDEILKYIRQMLMEEEELENKPCMLYDSLALQATEKSFYDVLNHEFPQTDETPDDVFSQKKSNSYLSSENSSADVVQSDVGDSQSSSVFASYFQSSHAVYGQYNGFREKKNRYRDDGENEDYDHRRSNKKLADYDNGEESVALEIYDEVLLCSDSEIQGTDASDEDVLKTQVSDKGRAPRGRGRKKRAGTSREVVDMSSMLLQCAQAVANFDSRTVEELLKSIRRHSSPNGEGTDRLAHYFANALEARLAGTGAASSFLTYDSKRISAAETLKAYQLFITSCPFKKMSNIFANRSIKKLVSRARARSLHIIDFGILYGFQWPCLIHIFSTLPGGPPRLRITGIDLPQPGFRPAERVQETGRRLERYCERFGVPFEFNAIAKKWETIRLHDLKINKDEDEILVVNCLCRLQNVPDETVMVNSPRDAVLDLIRRIHPNLFIHGIVNGTYNSPFFIPRFREALFHFSSVFDMFDATIASEDQERVLLEREIYGKEIMNIIACEGTERVERPETYKQWQVRNLRAGFRQLPLDKEIVRYIENKVKLGYHKDFSVDEDRNWMLQGWKGRVSNALSCYEPNSA